MQKNTLTIIWLSILSALVLYIGYTQFSKSQKLVYIDNNKLLNNYQGMLDARQAFQSKATVWQANIDTLMSEVQKSIMDYEKGSGKMTTKERELSKELIRTKQKQLKDYQVAINEKSSAEDQQVTQGVLTVVNAFIEEYGKENNYKLILGATTAGNIVYAEESMDITDEVLAALNAQYVR